MGSFCCLIQRPPNHGSQCRRLFAGSGKLIQQYRQTRPRRLAMGAADAVLHFIQPFQTIALGCDGSVWITPDGPSHNRQPIPKVGAEAPRLFFVETDYLVAHISSFGSENRRAGAAEPLPQGSILHSLRATAQQYR